MTAAVERLVDLYCRLLKVAIALCLAAMVVLVFSNVVMRYLFNSGIPTSEELSRWLLVWLTFLGAIVALRQHAHLGVDTLVRALPPLGKKVCFVASYVLMLYADWLLTLGSWKQAVLTLADSAPASGISRRSASASMPGCTTPSSRSCATSPMPFLIRRSC